MSKSQRIGLYYPYLHFPDNWLKIAALYWPRMGRIAPAGIHLNDSGTVQALSDELDFTVNVEPDSAGEELTYALTSALENHYDEFRRRYSVSPNASIRSTWCGPTGPEPKPTPNPWSGHNLRELKAAGEVVALHVGKGTNDLWQILSGAGLAIQSGDWWALHPELAWEYMCALADKLGRRNLLTPTTDHYFAHVASLSWTDEVFVNTLLKYEPGTIVVPQMGHRERIALLALNLVVPSNLDTVPVRKIIKLRQNYAADFDAFYDEVADLANSVGGELSQIADPNVLATYIENEAQRRFRQPLDNLRRAMRGQGVDSTYTALTTKFELPVGAAIFTEGELTNHPTVAASGVLALGVLSAVRSFRRARRQVTPSAASYLWRVEGLGNPENLMRNLVNKMY